MFDFSILVVLISKNLQLKTEKLKKKLCNQIIALYLQLIGFVI